MNYNILINKENKIPDDFNPKLVNTNSTYKKNNIMLEEQTNKKFIELKNNAFKNNYIVEIESGYRTHDYQQKLVDNLIKEKGLKYAEKYIARPYTSEHETGLALDFCVFKNNKYLIEHEIKDLDETKWIHENCYKFGFILRYPKNKEAITGYNYEPWHLRYVGNIAEYLYKNNLTLEEYHNGK